MLKLVDTGAIITKAYADALAAMNVDGALRYLRRHPNDPSRLTPHEVSWICSAGLSIGSVFEHHSDRLAYLVEANGALDGASAVRNAKEINQPLSSAIYGAIDTDITDATLPLVKAYWLPFAQTVKGAGYGVGIYGDDAVLEAICGWTIDGFGDAADHAWLTNAKGWIADKTFDDWDIRQTSTPVTLPFGLQVDYDEAYGEIRAGLWRIAA